ncbi:hypothetical protein [Hyphobacterium sp.]|uniref:hypothetical protein n=1 Tax=Hyphobacterium sp. TaxID=2004662 RepID=UPI003BA9EAC8
MINPFLIAAIFALLAALALCIRWIIAAGALRQEARQEYAGRQTDRAQTIKGVSEAEFVRIYLGGYSPRWTLYAAAALIAAILITAPAVMGLVYFWNWVTAALGAGDVFAPGYYPWMFYMFFGLVASWAFCGFVAARFHHARAPEPFQPALMRARGESLDDVEIKRPRPKWAKRAKLIAAERKNQEAP